MNGRPMNALEYYALMARQMGPQGQVPQGNPTADYFEGRAGEYGQTARKRAAQSGVAMAVGAAFPSALPITAPLTLLAGYDGLEAIRNQQDMAGGYDMWFNRFGSGDPNQGLPGTPSGPAYRRR